MFRVVLLAPAVQLILLGYAATFDVREIKTVVIDNCKSSASRELIRAFESSGYFTVVHYTSSYNKLEEMIDNGTAFMGIVIPGNFEKLTGRNEPAPLQTIIDGSDGNKAGIAAGYCMGVIRNYSVKIISENLLRAGKTSYVSQLASLNAGNIEPEVRIWYNPDLTTRYYMLPALFGLLIMLVTTNLTSLAIVKEREIGTLEQLIVTPIKPYQMILGKLIPFTILGYIASALVITVMRFWFGIEIKGSIWFLAFAGLIFMFSSLGLGLLVSTFSKSQKQAMIVSSFGVLMPMIFLSGFAFPIENMPQVVQYFTYLVPLRYFITILRGVILKGIGIYELWNDLLIMFVFGVLILTLSSLRFRKKLE